MSDLPEEFRHEPSWPGVGPDGLKLTKRLLANAADFLKEDGVLVVEVGNSMIHLEAQFPEVPFTWVQFENGGHGVFVMTRAELEQYPGPFRHLQELSSKEHSWQGTVSPTLSGHHFRREPRSGAGRRGRRLIAGAGDKRRRFAGDLDRRKPGTSRYTTQRREADEVKILRGVRGQDHGHLHRAAHREHRSAPKDYLRSRICSDPATPTTPITRSTASVTTVAAAPSARETAMRVAAGAIAKKYLETGARHRDRGFSPSPAPSRRKGSTRARSSRTPSSSPMRASWRR